MSDEEGERVILLDGGMGTTLESRGYDVSTALWGSDLLITDPKAIQDVHRGYLEAGSDLIQTATYPLTPDNVASFMANGSDECHLGRAWSVLHRSVKIVSDLIEDEEDSEHDNANTTLLPEQTAKDGDSPQGAPQAPRTRRRRKQRRGIVLSCGPYGATLKPGQEYAGVYPAPFGPRDGTNRFSSSSKTSTAHESGMVGEANPGFSFSAYSTVSADTSDNGTRRDAEAVAISYLAEWYLTKLRVFAFAPSPSVYRQTQSLENGHGCERDGESGLGGGGGGAAERSAWRDIEWIAFETIPLLYEIKAIRRAMSILRAELERKYGEKYDFSRSHSQATDEAQVEGSREKDNETRRAWWDKKFWITSAYPNGLHPQTMNTETETDSEKRDHDGEYAAGANDSHAYASIPQVLEALVGVSSDADRNGDGDGESERDGDGARQGTELAIPDGVGINCTHPQYLPRLASEFTEAYKAFQQRQHHSPPRSENNTTTTSNDELIEESGAKVVRNRVNKIRFVVYPDGGQVYDVNTRSWKEENTPRSSREWAERVMETVKAVNDATMGGIEGSSPVKNSRGESDGHSHGGEVGEGRQEEKVWGGVIVGGCCKTTSDEIRALRELIDSDEGLNTNTT
ncbi:hypothetical protein IAU59_005343 [Kwoniella sp. CBS 9459]